MSVKKINRGLSEMEARKYRVIYEVIQKRLKKKHASEELNLSTRQISRLVKKVKRNGANGLIHGLVGKKGNRAFAENIENEIIDLWEKKYSKHDFNFTHFFNKLNEVENIKVSREKVRLLLKENGYSSSYKRKVAKHKKKRERKLRFGEMTQQDTSPHDWLGTGTSYHLVTAIDDATSKLLFMKLFESDGTLPNMEAFMFVMTRYGIPLSYYVDGAAWFNVTRKGEGTINQVLNRKKYETQIERALKELGVKLIIAKSAPAKGRVERSNRTSQDRLISELSLRNIKTIGEANKYIEEEYIKEHNRRFAKEPIIKESVFLPFVSKEALRQILCQRFFNRVKNDNTISKSKYYELQLLPTEKRHSWAKAKVQISIMVDGEIEVRHNETRELIPYEIISLKSPAEKKHVGKKEGAGALA